MTIEGAYQQIKEWDLPFYAESSRKKVLETIEEYFDAVPVVYADVTEQGGNEWWACENCNCWSNNMLIVEYKRPNYCPNCGAKFRWNDGEQKLKEKTSDERR